MEHYDSIIKAREVIKRKFNELRRGESEASTVLEKAFKPITDPLNTMVKLSKVDGNASTSNNLKKESTFYENISKPNNSKNVRMKDELVDPSLNSREFDNDNVEIVRESSTNQPGSSIESYLQGIDKKGLDITYGVRRGNKNWLLGSEVIAFYKNGEINIGNETFNVSPGLLELLFKRKPEGYTEEDIETYKRMLEISNAHKRGYEKDNAINRNNTNKYKLVIGKLFPQIKGRIKRGFGAFVPLTERTYIYWDDPNELVERLSLLLASKRAGHTGHEREILSIEEELRESGYIL